MTVVLEGMIKQPIPPEKAHAGGGVGSSTLAQEIEEVRFRALVFEGKALAGR